MVETGVIRALLIEDSPADALLVRQMLREAEDSRFELETSARLDSALAVLEAGRFDVVLVDLNLPDSRGITTFEKVQSTRPDLPVILLTGLDDKHLADQALQNGAQDYIVKGRIEPVLLQRSIRYAIERKRVALENLRLYQQAQEANRAKDEFLATLSHELRTPLSSILGWASMLRRGGLDPAPRERALETLERNARLQVRLIDDLLDISRIINGKFKLDVRPVNLITIMMDTIDATRLAAEAKNVAIIPAVDPDVPSVAGDAERIQQVFWNLIANSVKFTPEGGRIEVELRSRPGAVEFQVRDNGAGIAAGDLPHIFDRFRQADSSAVRQHGGLGLGLTLVEQLVELHGGIVSAESAGLGQGSTFSVRLPAPLRSLGNRAPVPSESRPGRLDGVHVLVVEDDDDQATLMRTMLEQCGARVTTARASAAGYEALLRQRPDLILADIAMPDQDGYDFIARVRRLPEEQGGRTPAAALTAYARPEDRIRAIEAGFQAWAPKPIDPETLVRTVQELLAKHT